MKKRNISVSSTTAQQKPAKKPRSEADTLNEVYAFVKEKYQKAAKKYYPSANALATQEGIIAAWSKFIILLLGQLIKDQYTLVHSFSKDNLKDFVGIEQELAQEVKTSNGEFWLTNDSLIVVESPSGIKSMIRIFPRYDVLFDHHIIPTNFYCIPIIPIDRDFKHITLRESPEAIEELSTNGEYKEHESANKNGKRKSLLVSNEICVKFRGEKLEKDLNIYEKMRAVAEHMESEFDADGEATCEFVTLVLTDVEDILPNEGFEVIIDDNSLPKFSEALKKIIDAQDIEQAIANSWKTRAQEIARTSSSSQPPISVHTNNSIFNSSTHPQPENEGKKLSKREVRR